MCPVDFAWNIVRGAILVVSISPPKGLENIMVVYTVGTFDLLHVGHLALLEYCRTLGDVVAVGGLGKGHRRLRSKSMLR